MKTYTFHVSQPGGGRVWRKIELSGDQTLEELHFAIQDAYDWDADHLYSFFMSGRAWDSSSEYCLPEDADAWGLDLDDEDEEVDDEAKEGELRKAPGRGDQSRRSARRNGRVGHHPRSPPAGPDNPERRHADR